MYRDPRCCLLPHVFVWIEAGKIGTRWFTFWLRKFHFDGWATANDGQSGRIAGDRLLPDGPTHGAMLNPQ
jgi:hypothetical protein